MSSLSQAKILRAIENKIITRVGDDKEIKVDVRIICATNVQFADAIKQNKFRADLYYRLGTRLKLPSLLEWTATDRAGLIDHLILDQYEKHFRNRTAPLKLTSVVKKALVDRVYHGNIRELNWLIQELYIFNEHTVSVLDSEFSEVTEDNELDMEVVEKNHIIKLLKHTNGNKTRILPYMHMVINTLNERIETYGIVPSEYKKG